MTSQPNSIEPLTALARRVFKEVTCFCLNETCIACEAKNVLKEFCRPEKLRAGDVVRHLPTLPTGEDWTLACDEERDRVQPAGWPNTLAEAADCILLKPATDEEHERMLRRVADMNSADPRRAAARHQLAELERGRSERFGDQVRSQVSKAISGE